MALLAALSGVLFGSEVGGVEYCHSRVYCYTSDTIDHPLANLGGYGNVPVFKEPALG